MVRSVENDKIMLLSGLQLKRQMWLKQLSGESNGLHTLGYHDWSAKVSDLRLAVEDAFDKAIEEIHGEL